MTVREYDSVTGEVKTTTYSKYYDAGAWVIPDKIGIVVVVDHNTPVYLGLDSLNKAAGTYEDYSIGKVSLYFFGFDIDAHDVVILQVASRGSGYVPEHPNVKVEPQSKTGGYMGFIKIHHDDTSLPLIVDLTVDGSEPMTIEFTLPRRTMEELQKYFAPGGTPPYPWEEEGIHLNTVSEQDEDLNG